MLIFYKEVDKSVLSAGFSIPVTYIKPMFDGLGFHLQPGEKRIVQILIDGVPYNAAITNINFDRNKYPGHSDLLQIRYGAKSPLAQKLNEVFVHSLQLIEERKRELGTTRISDVEENRKEYLAVYSTDVPGAMVFECITNAEFIEESSALTSLGEQSVEGILDGTDETAGIRIDTKTCKIRHLSRSITQNLKIAYGYRCQICGQYIGERYGSTLIHAHHIDYFTRSLNNNADNILILCPNHHGIIHDTNPLFDRKTKIFRYPNGYSEGLTLNLHV